jgi:pyruvate formate lyase activating enzyme
VVGKPLDISSIVQEALADEIFYKHSGGGVTISGGEPLLYPEFLLELTRTLKKKGSVHIAIETSGFAKWESIAPLLETIDLFIVDIKTLSPGKYRDVIGGSLRLVLANIERLIESGAAVRIHLPIIPGFNDSPADTEAYVDYLGRFADKLAGVDILPFHSYALGKYAQLGQEYQYKGVNDLASQQVVPLLNALKERGLRQVTVGGIAGTATLTDDGR